MEREFEPTICIDIMDFDPKILPMNPTVVLASPPCQKFSPNTIRFNWNKRYVKDFGVIRALGLVGKTYDIIMKLQPRYWVIENPRGMLRKAMGKPTVETYFRSFGTKNLKPTDLWGIFPKVDWPKPEPGWETDGTRKIEDSAEAAKIPYGLSNLIARGIENELLIPRGESI
jgi:site-specific DNA-cytosine methylase